MAPKRKSGDGWQLGHSREKPSSAFFKWKGESSPLNKKKGEKAYAEVAKINSKDEFFYHLKYEGGKIKVC